MFKRLNRRVFTFSILAVTAAFTMAASTPVFAHEGHHFENGLSAGLMHPLSGYDHIMLFCILGALWGTLAHKVSHPAILLVALLATPNAMIHFLLLPPQYMNAAFFIGLAISTIVLFGLAAILCRVIMAQLHDLRKRRD